MSDLRMKIDQSNSVKSVICLVKKVRRRALAPYLKILDLVNRRLGEKGGRRGNKHKEGRADQEERGIKYIWLQGRSRITPVLPRSW